jgi:hypothetical protein
LAACAEQAIYSPLKRLASKQPFLKKGKNIRKII